MNPKHLQEVRGSDDCYYSTEDSEVDLKLNDDNDNANGDAADADKLARHQAVDKKRKKAEPKARTFQTTKTDTYTLERLLSDVNMKCSADSDSAPLHTIQITRSNVPVGTRVLQVTNTAGDSKMNSCIKIMPETLVSSSSSPEIVVDNIHKCRAIVECMAGKIEMNKCTNVALVLKTQVDAVLVQESESVSLQLYNDAFPSSGIICKNVLCLWVYICARDETILDHHTIDKGKKVQEGVQSVLFYRHGRWEFYGDNGGEAASAVVKPKKNGKRSDTSAVGTLKSVVKPKKEAKKLDRIKDCIGEEEPTTIPLNMTCEDAENMTYEDAEKLVAFCCFNCHCSEDTKKQIPSDYPFVQSGEGSLYHRRCCHNVIVVTQDWRSPMDKASVKARKKPRITYEGEEKKISLREFKEIVQTAHSYESEFFSKESLLGKLFHHTCIVLSSVALLAYLRCTCALVPLDPTKDLLSSSEYIENMKVFEKLPKRAAAVVLVSAPTQLGINSAL
jgi:hypothetical protein